MTHIFLVIFILFSTFCIMVQENGLGHWDSTAKDMMFLVWAFAIQDHFLIIAFMWHAWNRHGQIFPLKIVGLVPAVVHNYDVWSFIGVKSVLSCWKCWMNNLENVPWLFCTQVKLCHSRKENLVYLLSMGRMHKCVCLLLKTNQIRVCIHFQLYLFLGKKIFKNICYHISPGRKRS